MCATLQPRLPSWPESVIYGNKLRLFLIVSSVSSLHLYFCNLFFYGVVDPAPKKNDYSITQDWAALRFLIVPLGATFPIVSRNWIRWAIDWTWKQTNEKGKWGRRLAFLNPLFPVWGCHPEGFHQIRSIWASEPKRILPATERNIRISDRSDWPAGKRRSAALPTPVKVSEVFPFVCVGSLVWRLPRARRATNIPRCGHETTTSICWELWSRSSSVATPPVDSWLMDASESPPRYPHYPDKSIKMEVAQEIPDGGVRAWLIVIASFLTNGLIFGIHNCYGIIYLELKNQLEESDVADAATKACKCPQ